MDGKKTHKSFRKHTPQERRDEKKRYRQRMKQLKKIIKSDKPKVLITTKSSAVQTEHVEEHLPKKSSPIKGRGYQMVSLARKDAPEKSRANIIEFQKPKQPSKSTSPKIPRPKELPRINREDLSYQRGRDNSIGSGSFGDCYKGVYRGNIPVVVKVFKHSVRKTEVVKEITAVQEIQSKGHHPCLPLVIGVSLSTQPYLLVTQFHGDIFIIKVGSTTTSKRITLCYIHLKNNGDRL